MTDLTHYPAPFIKQIVAISKNTQTVPAIARISPIPVEKSLIKQISEKEIQTEDDKVILNMLQNGGSAVSEENLKDIFALMAL